MFRGDGSTFERSIHEWRPLENPEQGWSIEVIDLQHVIDEIKRIFKLRQLVKVFVGFDFL